MSSDDEIRAERPRNAAVTATLIQYAQSDQQLLASILEHTHMLVAYLDVRFNFVRVNRAYAQADGKTEDFFPGHNHFDLFPNEENLAIFGRVVETGEPYFAQAKAFEYAENTERGTSYWDWSLVPTKAVNGEVTGLVLTLADVTQAAETRESLRRERDLADGLIRTARAIILVLDRQGNIVRFNPYLEELCGHRLEDVIGTSWFETFIVSDERVRVAALFDAAISGIETCGNVNAILAKNGGRRTIQWFDTTLHDAQGNVSGLLAVGIDNTELLASEQDLMLFKSIVRSSSEAIAIADQRGRVIFVNEAYEALYGYSEAEVLGRECLSCFVGTDAVPVEIPPLIQEGTSSKWEGEARAQDRHGRQFPIWMRLDYTCREAGGNRHYILLAHDITAQKQSEQQRLDNERGRYEVFIREIHHRIKNHLQGVIGLLENSMTKEGLPASRFEGLVGKIGALAGVYDVGSRQIGSSLLLAELVNSGIAIIRELMGTKCPIESSFSEGVAWLDGEESVSVALTLNELITNACKHRQASCDPVRVSMVLDGHQAVLTVVNTGTLPEGFSFRERLHIGMGLSLIQGLLPHDCASLSIEQRGPEVIARLMIMPPLLVIPAPLGQIAWNSRPPEPHCDYF